MVVVVCGGKGDLLEAHILLTTHEAILYFTNPKKERGFCVCPKEERKGKEEKRWKQEATWLAWQAKLQPRVRQEKGSDWCCCCCYVKVL